MICPLSFELADFIYVNYIIKMQLNTNFDLFL
jgi:hypothetical protein